MNHNLHIYTHLLTILSSIGICTLTPNAWADAPSLSSTPPAQESACDLAKEQPIAFTSSTAKDTIKVRINGDTCDDADVRIMIVDAHQQTVYDYTDQLRNLLPYAIRDPELHPLLESFAEKILAEAGHRSTQLLPPYTSSESYYANTNDFVIIPSADYEALRHRNIPMVWHVTGDSSWVHVVYDPKQHASRVIMRGGVFNELPRYAQSLP